MFCPNCGKQNNDNNAFCAECGTPLKKYTPSPAIPATPTKAPAPMKPGSDKKKNQNAPKSHAPGKESSKPYDSVKETTKSEEKEANALIISKSKSSKLLIPSVIIGLLLVLGGTYLGHCLSWWQIPFLKNTYSSKEAVDFIQLKNEQTREFIESDCAYSRTYSYDIEWPVGTNTHVVTILQNWVADQLLEGYGTVDDDIDGIIQQAAENYYENGSYELKTVNITAESNYPFESYLTMKSETQEFHSFNYGAICINLLNGTVFPANEAFENTNEMRKIIARNLQQKLAENNDEWSKCIMHYTPDNLPMPKSAPVLTPDGLEFTYVMYEISDGSSGEFSCTVPYDQAIPAITAQAKAFLPESIVEEAQKKANEALATKAEVIKFFYQTYYNKDIINSNDGRIGRFGYGYSEAIKNKFNELGISSEVDYPKNQELSEENDFYRNYYTDKLNSTLQRVTKKLKTSDNFEDVLMWHGEIEDIVPFDLEIKEINQESPTRIVLTVKEIDGYDMPVVLIKENDKWYIDDIYDYRNNSESYLNH